MSHLHDRAGLGCPGCRAVYDSGAASRDAAPPALRWGKPEGEFMTVAGTSFKTVAHRRAAEAAGWKYSPRLPTALRNATPIPFRDLLRDLAIFSRHTPEAP